VGLAKIRPPQVQSATGPDKRLARDSPSHPFSAAERAHPFPRNHTQPRGKVWRPWAPRASRYPYSLKVVDSFFGTATFLRMV